MWKPVGEDDWVAQVQWRPVGTNSRRISDFPADHVRPDLSVDPRSLQP